LIAIHAGLFVGNQADYDFDVAQRDGWAVVHACKEPYHRQALGYRSRGAPKDHPEYLVARRGNRLILNIVDTDNPTFFAKEMIDAALDFVDEAMARGLKVLIHCNEGQSRSPSIALVYLAARLGILPTDSLGAAEEQFRAIYPNYYPKPGIRGHIQAYWSQYCSEGTSTSKGRQPVNTHQ
jgi:predicted protein tyrosine phosphatase